MDIKKCLRILAFILVLVLTTSKAYAEESGYNYKTDMINYGETIMTENIKKDYYDIFGEEFSINNFKKLSSEKIIKSIALSFKNKIKEPFKVIEKVILISLFLGIINLLSNKFGEKEINRVFNTITILCISGTVIKPVINCVKYSSAAIKNCNTFISTLAPQLGAVLLTMGRPGAAEVYNVGVLGICNLSSAIINKIGIPLLGVFMSLSLIGLVTENKELSDLGNLFKKADVWILNLSMFVFTSVLGLNTFIGAAGDNFAGKAIKHIVTEFVPIVGSAISEAYSTAAGCMKIIKSSIGTMGAVGIIFCFLPSLISAICWYFTCSISSLFLGLMGLSSQGKIFEICAMGIKITLSFLSAYIVMTIIAVGMVIFISTGV